MNAQVKPDWRETERPDSAANAHSVLVVTRDQRLADGLGDTLRDHGGLSVRTRAGSIDGMDNGTFEKLLRFDMLVLEVDPEDEAAMAALRELLALPHPKTRFLVLTRDDLSLAQARHLVQIGADEVLPVSTPADEFLAAVEKRLADLPMPGAPTAAPPPAPPAPKLGSVIAVAGARGGVGATSVAVNLAALLLSPRGFFNKKPTKKVVLVDLDLQFGTAGILLDLEDNGGMMQIVRNPTPPDAEFLNGVILQHPSGLHVLTAPTEPVPLDAMKAEHVGALLDILKRQYDYVVVDLPRALVLWLDPVLRRTDSLMLVTDTSVPCIRQCRRLIDIYTEENLKLPIEIVVNGEKRPLFHSAHHKEAAKLLDTRLRTWLPRDEKPMRLAADRGAPLVTLSARSKLADAYRRMAADLIKSFVANAGKTA